MANWSKKILGNDDSNTDEDEFSDLNTKRNDDSDTDDDEFSDLNSNLNLDATYEEENNFGIDLEDSFDSYEIEEALEEKENEGYSAVTLDLENEDDKEDGEEDFDSDSDLEDNDN